MTFLTPALLAGLAAIVIPILVHLIQRERRRLIPFPSLMFLRKIPYQSVRRRAIRHWPLLVLRVLAISAVVLAFARPYVRGARLEGSAGAAGRELVILLDRSFSMGYGDIFARAKAEAASRVRALDLTDRASLVLFASDVEIAVRASDEHGALLTAIDRASLSAGTTRYGPALRAAAGLLEASRAAVREVVLISDFQQSGWDRTQEVRLPTGVTLTPVVLTASQPANASVSGVTIERDARGVRNQISISARIANHGASSIGTREAMLEADGQPIETRRVSIGPQAATVVSFAPLTIGRRPVRIAVRLAADRLPVDDQFLAVVPPTQPIPVLLIEGPSPSPTASLYIRRALAVGATPGFETSTVPVPALTEADLSRADVIIVNDTRPPVGAMGRALEARVRQGAGLLAVLGERTGWPADAPDLLPGSLGGVVDRAGTHGGTLGHVDYSHPVFEIFREPRSGDLTAARAFRYRQFAATGTVACRFDDGAPALVERGVGRGLVLAWTSALDGSWNDLVLKPVFLPFLHEAVKYLARYAEPRLWYTVGETLDAAAVVRSAGLTSDQVPSPALVIVSPHGTRQHVTDDHRREPVVLDEQGFYTVRPSAAGSADAGAIAVNVAADESDLTPMDPEALAGTVASPAIPAAAGGDGRELTAQEAERRQAWWWYLLAAGLALLATEAIVARRLPRAG